MNYRYEIFKHVATPDGFNYPIDVFYGTIYLGTLEVKPDGFVIRMIDTPVGKQSVKQSDTNKFRSQNQAAEYLHRSWKMIRAGQEYGGEYGGEEDNIPVPV